MVVRADKKSLFVSSWNGKSKWGRKISKIKYWTRWLLWPLFYIRLINRHLSITDEKCPVLQWVIFSHVIKTQQATSGTSRFAHMRKSDQSRDSNPQPERPAFGETNLETSFFLESSNQPTRRKKSIFQLQVFPSKSFLIGQLRTNASRRFSQKIRTSIFFLGGGGGILRNLFQLLSFS